MNILKRNIFLIAVVVTMIILATFTTLGHAKGLVGPPEMEAGVVPCTKEGSNALECARGIEKKQLKEPGSLANRKGKTLTITVGSKKVTFKDSGQDNAVVAHSYLGLDHTLHAHLVYVQYYEGGDYILVQQESGLKTDVSKFPIASADGKHFADFSSMLGYDAGYTSDNKVSIWSTEGGKLVQVAQYKGMAWGPSAITWTPAGFRVDKICEDKSGKTEEGVKPCGIATIVKTTGAWKLIDNNQDKKGTPARP